MPRTAQATSDLLRPRFDGAGLYVIALIAITLELPAFPGTFDLRFDAHLIAEGEWWRFLSGHFVHGSWPHWAINLAGLVLIQQLYGVYFKQLRWVPALFFCLLGTSSGLYLFNSTVSPYVGLSGVLTGLLLIGALSDAMHGHRSSLIILAILFIKTGWEQWQGASTWSEQLIAMPVAIEAHLYGALSGLTYTLFRQGVMSLCQHFGQDDRTPD